MKILITGIAGMDGSHLAEYLLNSGHEVHGTIRRNSSPQNQTTRLSSIFHSHRLKLHYADITDLSCLISIMKASKPDYIFHLAAMSHVKISFENPIYTMQNNVIGTMNMLEAMRLVCPEAKLYFASSSEQFGNKIDHDGFQRETTPMHPVSPYGVSKLAGFNMIRNYRHSYDMFLSNGILFNHESPRRGENFVTNKVCKGAVEIYRGKSEKLHLGNLDASRDWGSAKDYVKAMWMILQHDKPDDFVCATGTSHTVRQLCEYVFSYLGMDCKNYVISDQQYMRPEELNFLKGDCSKLKNTLGWSPSYTFETMLQEMIEYWKGRIV